MSGTDADIERARRQALNARERIARTLAELQERVSPANLMNGAWDDILSRGTALADSTVQTVRRRPAVAGAAAAAVLLVAARKPIGRLIRRLRGGDATAEPPKDYIELAHSSGPAAGSPGAATIEEKTQ